MPELTNPHDKFFKAALTQPEAARTFLRDYLPAAVVEQLDLNRLQLLKDVFVDDALREHFADLLYEVGVQGRGNIYVSILFEHKSYADSLTALQVLRYMVQVWDYSLRQRGRLWPILPVVVYHGATRWTVAAGFQALFDEIPVALCPYVPEYQYLLRDLSEYSDAELKGSAELGVGLLLLKHIFQPDLRARLPEVLALWYTMHEQEHALGYLEAILRYVTAAGEGISVADVQLALAQVAPEGGALMGTIAQEWVLQGEQQGLQQGLQQGKQQGLRQGLLSGIRLALKLKFGVEGVALMPEIYQIEDVALLQVVQDGLELVDTLAALRRLYQHAV